MAGMNGYASCASMVLIVVLATQAVRSAAPALRESGANQVALTGESRGAVFESKRSTPGARLFEYDALGRMVLPGETQAPDPRTMTYVYDAHGRLTKATGPDGVIYYRGKAQTYFYDAFGRRSRASTD